MKSKKKGTATPCKTPKKTPNKSLSEELIPSVGTEQIKMALENDEFFSKFFQE